MEPNIFGQTYIRAFTMVVSLSRADASPHDLVVDITIMTFDDMLEPLQPDLRFFAFPLKLPSKPNMQISPHRAQAICLACQPAEVMFDLFLLSKG